MDDTSIPSLGRADSGGSASSSASSSSTLSSDDAASRCSSLFSSADTTASDGERRSSFASSVFADDDEGDDDEACKNQAQAQADDDATPTASEESTPSPGPLRMSLSRSISSSTTASTSTSNSDDNLSSSSSSHGSFISTTNMATPTAELYALSLHPISPPSTSARNSGLASTTATGDQVVATATSSASSNEGQQGPHYVEGTNNSIIASNNGGRTTTRSAATAAATKSFIPATSPDMLRFAARVASRGIPFTSPQNKRSHSLQLSASAVAASTTPGTTTSSSASSARPSSSRGLPGKVLNAEGFPWTARPSSYTPRSTPSSSRYQHNNDQGASSSTSRSRPSTSSGSSSGNTRYASSFGGTPSTIFASFEEDEDNNIIENQSESESEDEMEALSEFFPSSFSSGKSHSRPVTRHGNNSSTTTTTKYESSFSSMQYRDNTAPATSSSQSGAITVNTAPGIRHAVGLIAAEQVQGGKVGQLHDSPVSTASNRMSQASPVHYSDSDSLTRAEKETGQGNQRGTRPEYINNSEIRSDQHQARHSSTPPLVDDSRSMRGAPESLQSKPSCEKTSSSSSPSAPLSSGTKIDSTHAPSVSTSSIGSASTPSLFSSSEERYHPTRFDRDTIIASTRSSRSPTQSPDSSSPSSPFRYEAPSSSSAMAAATATMTLPQQQVKPPSRATTSPPPMLSITTSASPRQNANTTSKAIDASTYATSISSPLATRNVENAEVLTAAHDDVVSAGVNSNRHATQGRTASLDDYGRDLKHGASSSSYGVHLNSLNYQAGSGNSAYSSSRPSTNTSSSSSAYLTSMQNNNYNGCALGSATTRTWSRPWVKDSDTSSIKSSSALSSDGSRSSFENSDREPSVMSPAAPLHVPFLSTAPAPPGCKIIVEALQPDGFDIFITLPGFSHENITLALKKSGALHVLADKYDEDSHGHFERMVELGEPAKDCKVTAVFNGDIVEVHVRKLPKEEIVSATSISNWSYPSSASSASSSSYKSIGSYSPSMYHGGTDPVAFYSSSPLLAGASYMAK